MRSHKLKAYLSLSRAFESTLVAGTISTGLIFSGITSLDILIVVFFVAFFANTGVASWNDALDVNEDRISHPSRPIPSGTISVSHAKFLGTGILFIDILFSIVFLPEKVILIIVLGIFVGIVYSYLSKGQFLAKNLTVAGSFFIGFLLLPWGYGLALTPLNIYLALSLALLLSGYEILKDIHDIKGDMAAGVDTVAIRIGPRRAAVLSLVLFLVSCGLMLWLFWEQGLVPEFWITLATTVLLFMPFSLLIKAPTPQMSVQVRLVVIFLLGVSLSSIAYLIYFRNIG